MEPWRMPDHHIISTPAHTVTTNVTASSVPTPSANSPACCADNNNVSTDDNQST